MKADGGKSTSHRQSPEALCRDEEAVIVLTPDLALSKSRSTHSRGSEGCFYLSEAAGKEVTPFTPYRLAGQDFLCIHVVLNGP